MPDLSSVDDVVAEFERRWLPDKPASIGDLLSAVESDDQSLQRSLQVELVCVDIEMRWKHASSSEIKTVEDYAADFPDLGAPAGIPLLLIEEEYRARHRWGDAPNHASYAKRFSDRKGEIVAALARIDEQLSREFPRSHLAQQPEVHDEVSEGEGLEGLRRLDYSDYLLRQMVGAGQMGRVYRASRATRNETVAIKFLRKAFCRDGAAVQRFLQEARIVSQLHHEGIVGVHGVGRTPGGGHFIVMEYLKGSDLATAINRGPIVPRRAMEWTIQAAHAIDFANNAGVIHCDLKPGNLVLDEHDNVKVTDFGLARSANETSGTVDRIAGTAAYMAPEQISGWWGDVGPETDVYALGAVLYCLLTGQPPYVGDTVTDVLSCVVSGRQPAPPHQLRPAVCSTLSSVVCKALAKEPGKRFHAASEMAKALAQIR